jgi:hypothetical protein
MFHFYALVLSLERKKACKGMEESGEENEQSGKRFIDIT